VNQNCLKKNTLSNKLSHARAHLLFSLLIISDDDEPMKTVNLLEALLWRESKLSQEDRVLLQFALHKVPI
jgi:hypothetical protein